MRSKGGIGKGLGDSEGGGVGSEGRFKGGIRKRYGNSVNA